jgi:hypothetical protein
MTDSKHEQNMLQDVLTMGSAWSKDGERIDPTSVYAPVQEYTIRDSRPENTIRFYNGAPDNTEVLRISKDGIWANPDVPTDEAAKKVLEALEGYLKPMLDKARDAAYNQVLQDIKEMRPATKAVKDKDANWWLDRFEEAVKVSQGRIQ